MTALQVIRGWFVNPVKGVMHAPYSLSEVVFKSYRHVGGWQNVG